MCACVREKEKERGEREGEECVSEIERDEEKGRETGRGRVSERERGRVHKCVSE